MNSVNIIGNLTRDPELRTTPGGTSVCSLGIAVNDRKPDGNGGWEEYAHFFNVTVWGQQGDLCAQYLAKGKKIAVSGKLEYRQWEASDGSGKRSAVEIVAVPFGVTFLTPKGEGGSNGGGGNSFVPAAATYADDDIPF